MTTSFKEVLLAVFLALVSLGLGWAFLLFLKIPVLNVVLSVLYLYLAALSIMSLFRNNNGIRKAVEWMLTPLKVIADIFEKKTAQKWFTVGVIVAFFLVGVFVAFSLMIALRDAWKELVLCVGYIVIVIVSLTITLPSFAKLYNRIRVEPMGPYDVGMGKQLVNVFYCITILYNSIYLFLNNGSTNPIISYIFVPAFLTYIAIDRMRIQHAEIAKRDNSEQ